MIIMMMMMMTIPAKEEYLESDAVSFKGNWIAAGKKNKRGDE